MTESHEKSGQAPAQSSITTVSCFGTGSHDTSERRAGLVRYSILPTGILGNRALNYSL